MVKTFVAVAAVLLVAAMPAMAGFVSTSGLVSQYSDGSGDHWLINGTGVTLFEPAAPYNPPARTGIWSDNNTAPIAYPGESPAYVPSPGGKYDFSVAEDFDLEGLFYDYSGVTGELTVWLVASSGPNAVFNSDRYYAIGDIFIDVDRATDPAYDYAFLSFGHKPGLAGTYSVADDGTNHWTNVNNRDAGLLVPLTERSILYGINGSNSFVGDAGISGLSNPWALQNPIRTTGFDLFYQEITDPGLAALDYASGPAGYPPAGTHSTYVMQYNGYLPTGLDAGNINFHTAFQCGNDIIDYGVPLMPAPGALLLGLVGVAIVRFTRRRASA